MKALFGLLLTFAFWMIAFAGTPTLGFDQEFYTLSRAEVRDNTTINDYLRDQDKNENWSRMLSFKRYDNTKKISEVLPAYMASIKPNLAQKAKVFEKEDSQHAEEILINFVTVASDRSHYEYVLQRFFSDPGQAVRSSAFRLRIPYEDNMDFSQFDKNRNKWINALEQVNPEFYKTLPTEANEPKKRKQR